LLAHAREEEVRRHPLAALPGAARRVSDEVRRLAVAASLASARSRGVARAILFTGHDNVAAERAYVALGFRAIGDYAQAIFA
jgi:hypothetical protein